LNKQEILARLDFYQEAPPGLQSSIAAAARYVRLAPGDFLFREGDASREFAAVGVGSIRVFRVFHCHPRDWVFVVVLEPVQPQLTDVLLGAGEHLGAPHAAPDIGLALPINQRVLD
jgi:hypothetical protein